MLKNVTLLSFRSSDKQSWRLLDPDGRPIPAFGVFARTLERRSINTRKNYLRWLAEFFDYLFEAAACFADGATVSHDALVDIVESFDAYLVLGGKSGNQIAQRINETLPSPHNSRASSATKHAALRKFLKLSERTRVQILELTDAGYLQPVSDTDEKLIVGLGEHREPTAHERRSMVRNSMLSGCISKGPRLIEEAILPVSTPDITYDHKRAFPFDRVGDALAQLTTYRDKALYAFCAASGARVSEALQLLWQDVNMTGQKVLLVDPKSRPSSRSYLALEPFERDRLVWKGRATPLTLLIEPFATMFFEALASYLRYEYIPHGRHSFVFQYSHHGEVGQSYFLASTASRNGVIKRAMKLADVAGINGPHSFRHMYGTYLLNYFPRPNGTYGLPMALVQKFMGHKQIKDTQKYARHDKDLLEVELRYANMMLYGNGHSKSLNELKRNALLAKLQEVEKQLADELIQNLAVAA